MPPLCDVEGQDRALEGLKRALKGQRLHHAYLFAGPDGVGKRLAAQGLAEALLCEHPLDDGDACTQCKACRRVAEQQHPDLHVLERQDRPDGKGLERQIKIDQVRALQRALSFKSFEGGRRVVLLLEAEAMNPATANALLKTLEEPGDDTFFVLVSHAPNRLLPTILSRCQRVRFGPLSRAYVTRRLTELAELTPDAGALLAGLSEGSIGRGLALASSGLLARRAELIAAIDDPHGLRRLDALSELADQLGRDKAELPLFFLLLRTWYRDLLLLQAGRPAEALVHQDLADRARRSAAEVPFSAIDHRLALIQATERDILDGNANARLFLERLFVHLVDDARAIRAGSAR